VTYARVGRLCKYDLGGQTRSPSSGHFQTFSEARLLCPTTSGRDQFQFNNLEFTSVITGNDGEVYIYGLFRTAKPADNLLAVCRYSLTEIEKAFSNDKYYEISGSTMKIVTAAAYDSRHKTCNASLNTKANTHENYKEYKKRLIHVSVVSPDGGKLVITRNHSTIKDMLAESVTIANKSYDIVRLFDSKMVYELFVPTSFFKEKTGKTILSVRKISEEPLTVMDVAKIKFTGVESPVASLSVPTSAATTANKVDISSTPKPSSTQRSSESASSPSATMTGNLTTTSNRQMLGNLSTTSPNTSSDHETTASPSTKRVPAVPTTLGTSAKPRTAASVSLSSSWDRYIGQERIIVAAKERLLFVPIASCGALTCRECIEAKTPYCAWKNGHCVQLNATENGAYKQDIEHGDYSKLCPKVNATCKLVQLNKLIPRAGVTLQCSPAGVPTARVSYWSKDDKRLSNNSNEGVIINGGELKIRSYTPATAGKYTCHVINNGTSNSCSVEIP
ncbi:semaphorin-2A-like isoform X1, partial [Paramuricea clavata]